MILGIVSDLMDAIGDFFGEIIYKFLIGFCSAIYSAVFYFYQIFLALANVNIFDGKLFDTITSKIYIVLGVITLFALAYNLLNLIIDPTKDKGSKQVLDIIKKLITSSILIVIVPVIFKYAILVQNAVLTQNFIGELFTTAETDTNNELKYKVASLSKDYFRTFFESESDNSITNKSTYRTKSVKDENGNTVKASCGSKGNCSLSDVDKYVELSGDFYMYKAFALNVHRGNINFSWFFSIVVGCYIAYVLLSFCFDMATRQIKLIFYQLLAPICIACRVIPKQEKVFTNWISATFKTFMAVFVRLLLLSISVLLIDLIIKKWNISMSSELCKQMICSPGVTTFAKIFLIIACITFLKQGSKMICELFGFDDVKVKMGGKLKDSGAFMAGSAISSGVTNASRNSYNDFSKIKKGEGFKKNFGNFAKGVANAGTGFAGGFVNGAQNGKNTDSFKSMNSATAKTMSDLDAKRRQKSIDKANGNTPIKKAQRWFTGAVDNTSANSQILQMSKGLVDNAGNKIQSDSNKGKDFTYGIDRGLGTFSDSHLVDDKGNKRNIGYSAKTLRHMEDAYDEAKRSGSSTVSYVIDPNKVDDKGNVIREGNTATINLSDFENMMNSYREQCKSAESIYSKGGVTLDYATGVLHKIDQTLDDAKARGLKEVTITDSMGIEHKMQTGELADLKTAYLKSFEEALASVSAQTIEGYQEFLRGATHKDGSETITDLYNQALDLRTLLKNNPNAEIVSALRDIHQDFKEQNAFENAINKDQLKFFGNGLVADIKRANAEVEREIAEKMYKANTTKGGDKK